MNIKELYPNIDYLFLTKETQDKYGIKDEHVIWYNAFWPFLFVLEPDDKKKIKLLTKAIDSLGKKEGIMSRFIEAEDKKKTMLDFVGMTEEEFSKKI